MTDIDRYIAVSRKVVAAATANLLDGDTALTYCRDILPAVLSELEIAAMLQQRLMGMLDIPEPEPEPQPEPQPQPEPKPAAAKRPRKRRAKK